jgi:hypothetical protein
MNQTIKIARRRHLVDLGRADLVENPPLSGAFAWPAAAIGCGPVWSQHEMAIIAFAATLGSSSKAVKTSGAEAIRRLVEFGRKVKK